MKCVWIVLAAARTVLAADFALQEYMPPDTKVVMGLRVRALTESALFQQAGSQQTGDSAKTLKESWAKLTTFTGFDPLHDIDEVILTSAADRENAPALLVVRGRFNLVQLSAGAQRYHGVAMVGMQEKNAKSVVGLLDANIALVGEVPTVRAAIDRRGRPVVYDGALLSRVASLRERFDIWGTGERPQGFVAPGGQNEQLSSIDRFEFGLRITHGLELGGEIHARTQKDVEKLAGSLALLQMMAKAQSDTARFDVKVEDRTLKLSFAISEEELKKAIAAQQAGKPATSGRPTSPPPPGPPRITGQPTENARPPVTTPDGTSVVKLPGGR